MRCLRYSGRQEYHEVSTWQFDYLEHGPSERWTICVCRSWHWGQIFLVRSVLLFNHKLWQESDTNMYLAVFTVERFCAVCMPPKCAPIYACSIVFLITLENLTQIVEHEKLWTKTTPKHDSSYFPKMIRQERMSFVRVDQAFFNLRVSFQLHRVVYGGAMFTELCVCVYT